MPARMRILRAADYRRMPWKNGGGETREIAVSPTGAALDELDWRISLATVASDGPFSAFNGITRTLSVIHGAGIQLKIGDEAPVALLSTSNPYTFDGEAPAGAALIDGPIVDLNVMTKRGRFRHEVRRLALSGLIELTTAGDATIFFCRTGTLFCRLGTLSGELRPDDCVMFESAGRPVHLSAAKAADVYVIELYRELTRSG